MTLKGHIKAHMSSYTKAFGKQTSEVRFPSSIFEIFFLT